MIVPTVIAAHCCADPLSRTEPFMTRNTIFKKDGTASPYFWTEADTSAPAEKTVYKQTETGVKRMTGVHFDSNTKRIVKH
jgi:hypothetical protein